MFRGLLFVDFPVSYQVDDSTITVSKSLFRPDLAFSPPKRVLLQHAAQTPSQIPLYQGQKPRRPPAPTPSPNQALTLSFAAAAVDETIAVARRWTQAVRTLLIVEVSALFYEATQPDQTTKPRPATSAAVITRPVCEQRTTPAEARLVLQPGAL